MPYQDRITLGRCENGTPIFDLKTYTQDDPVMEEGHLFQNFQRRKRKHDV